MKKEWMYFIRGMALMGVVIFSIGLIKGTPTNCSGVAHYVNADGIVTEDELTDREIQIANELWYDIDIGLQAGGNYADLYARCVAIEEAF